MSLLIAYFIIGLILAAGSLLDDPGTSLGEFVAFGVLYPLLWLPLTAHYLYKNNFGMRAMESDQYDFKMRQRQQSDRALYGC